MRALAVVGVLLMAACSEPARPPMTQERLVERAAEQRAAPPEAAFAGVWRVTAVDGAPAAAGQSPILVRIDSGGMAAAADCAFLGERRYEVDGVTLRLTAPPSGMVTSCARGLSPLEMAFTEVFETGGVARLAGETLVVERNGRSATLVRRPGAPVRLALLKSSAAGDAATISGMLEAEGSCLYVRAIYRDRFLPAFQTPDTHWDAATGVLHVGDKRFTLGSRVRLGGSFKTGPGPLQWRQAPDPSCTPSRTWVTATVDSDTSPRPAGYTGGEIERMRADDAAK